jgi:hypothetical protein
MDGMQKLGNFIEGVLAAVTNPGLKLEVAEERPTQRSMRTVASTQDANHL